MQAGARPRPRIPGGRSHRLGLGQRPRRPVPVDPPQHHIQSDQPLRPRRRRPLAGGRQGALEPDPAFGEVPVPQPELGENPRQAQRRRSVAMLEQPSQRRSQIGMLRLEDGQPPPLGQAAVSLRLLGEGDVPGGVAAANGLGLAAGRELLQPVLANRL